MNGMMIQSSESLLMSLLRAAQSLEARLEEAFASVGLSPARYGVLEQLVRAGEPLALSELAAGQCCVRSNITQLVDRLEADGLVRRVNDPDDRRCIRAELTSAGRERQLEGLEQLRRVQCSFEAVLPEQEREALRRVLTALA